LNAFYIKQYPGSFARGSAYDEKAGPSRCAISGTTASLAGLESGEEHAVERVLLLYSICFSTGGIPVLNLGDEVGQLNDYGMPAEKDAEHDSRWIHRPACPTDKYEEKKDDESNAGLLFTGMRQLIEIRKKTDELGE
jgi:amylosucrase